jgi:hypothetical protein
MKKQYCVIERAIPFHPGEGQLTISHILSAYDKVAVRKARKLESKFVLIRVTEDKRVVYESPGFSDYSLYRRWTVKSVTTTTYGQK